MLSTLMLVAYKIGAEYLAFDRNARSRNGVLTEFMTSVVPYNDFLPGNVILPPRNRTFMTTGSSGRMGL